MANLHLLISENGQILGQTFSHDNAVRHTMIAKGQMFAASSSADLSRLPISALSNFIDEHETKDLKKIWSTLKKQSFPVWGKVSVQKVIRNMYLANGAAYTKDELIEMIPGATWISITTAFSMLKNKRYSKGKLLVIERKIDTGEYTRAHE